MEAFQWLSILASLGSIIVGALVKRCGKALSGGAALLFACIFIALILQLNMAGLPSAVLLLVAAVMIFVAPEQQFRNVTRVEPA